MSVAETDYKGNENIGFYGVVHDGYALFAPEFKHRDLFTDSAQLDIRIGGTNLIGLFAVGNANGLIIPDVIEEHEQSKLDETGIDYLILESNYTAMGNLILCNDHGCVISEDLEDQQETISDFLGVPVETATVAELDLPGSCGVATNNGVILHRDASEAELEHIESVLQVDGDIGSVNFGSPYVHAGILANSDELLIGNNTTGPELQRIQDALGFLD